jgi:hypothetical protein
LAFALEKADNPGPAPFKSVCPLVMACSLFVSSSRPLVWSC